MMVSQANNKSLGERSHRIFVAQNNSMYGNNERDFFKLLPHFYKQEFDTGSVHFMYDIVHGQAMHA